MPLKRCLPTGKAKGFESCNNQVDRYKYGMCKKCFREWLKTPEGIKHAFSYIPKAKVKVAKESKAKTRSEKQAIKSKSVFEKELQSLINTIVRLIDFDQGCISCNHGHTEPFTRQAHASHYWSVGSNPQLRFNLNNIHKSCSICNSWKHGNLIGYKEGIKSRYNDSYMNLIDDLPSNYQSIHLDKESLKNHIKIAKDIKKQIESGRVYSRSEINEIIAIYK